MKPKTAPCFTLVCLMLFPLWLYPYTIASWGMYHSKVLPAKPHLCPGNISLFTQQFLCCNGYGSFPLTEKQVPRGKCLLYMEIHCQEKVMHALVLMFNVIPWWPSAHTAGTFNLDDIGQQRESAEQMCFPSSKSLPICSTMSIFIAE